MLYRTPLLLLERTLLERTSPEQLPQPEQLLNKQRRIQQLSVPLGS